MNANFVLKLLPCICICAITVDGISILSSSLMPSSSLEHDHSSLTANPIPRTNQILITGNLNVVLTTELTPTSPFNNKLTYDTIYFMTPETNHYSYSEIMTLSDVTAVETSMLVSNATNAVNPSAASTIGGSPSTTNTIVPSYQTTTKPSSTSVATPKIKTVATTIEITRTVPTPLTTIHTSDTSFHLRPPVSDPSLTRPTATVSEASSTQLYSAITTVDSLETATGTILSSMNKQTIILTPSFDNSKIPISQSSIQETYSIEILMTVAPKITKQTSQQNESTTITASSSLQKTTTIGSTPTCSNVYHTRPNVGLNIECGVNSLTGNCIVSKSSCVEGHTSGLWICQCIAGYVELNDSCLKVPNQLFLNHEIVESTEAMNINYSIFMDLIAGINITSSTILVDDGSTELGMHSEVHINDNKTYELRFSNQRNFTKWKYKFTFIVIVTVGDLVVRDALTFNLYVLLPSIESEIKIFDGTAKDTVVGQLQGYNPPLNSSDLIYDNAYVYIGDFGLIYTTKDVDITEDYGSNVIAFAEQMQVLIQVPNQNKSGVIDLSLLFLRNVYIADPIPELSSSNTQIGTFNLAQPFTIEHQAFYSDNFTLYLGSYELDYSIARTNQEMVLLKSKDSEVNITITFDVIDINNNPPYYEREPYIFYTIQTAAIGSIVGVIEARDVDSGTQMNYSVNPNDMLCIDNYGVITLKQSILESDYYAEVEVSDGIYSNKTNIHIKSELLQKQTLGKSFTGSVKENTNESYIVTVTADGHDNFRFFDSDAYSSFDLNKTTGIVKSIRPFDRETEDYFTFTIFANKIGQPGSLVTVGKLKITVDDENDNYPVFEKLHYEAEVLEQTTNEVVKIQGIPIHTTDEDLDYNHSFKIINASTSLDSFTIDPETGIIRTTTNLIDRESMESVTLTVEASDGKHQNTTTVTVTLLDINDNDPKFEPMDTNFSVMENEAIGHVVTTVHANDIDVGRNGEIWYDIRPRGYFQINEATGEVSVGGKLDREQHLDGQRNLTVYAKDRGNYVRSSSISIFIEITDVNDENPMFAIDVQSKEVNESHDCGTPILTVSAHDDDEPGTNNSLVTYEILGESIFNISKDSGDIYVNCGMSLDYETKALHELIIIGKDQGVPVRSSTLTVHIQVLDVNDNHPMFVNEKSMLTISHFDPKVTRVIDVVNAIDSDSGENGIISYKLSGNASTFLQIDSRGVIKTQNVTTMPNTTATYLLNISATDNGRPKLTNYTIIEVKLTSNIGGNQEVLFIDQEIDMYVEENSPNRTGLGSIDSYVRQNYKLSYELIDDSNEFLINGSGYISTLGDLDREKRDIHTVVVRVKTNGDSPELSDLAMIRIHVNDTNDNSPVMPREVYYFQINEREESGSIVQPLQGHQNVTATDADIGENAIIKFKIVDIDEEDCKRHFKVTDDEHGSGFLTLDTEIDYEKYTFCQFNITAYNPNNETMFDTTQIHITIDDFNDNPPVFNEIVYNIGILENVTESDTIPIVMNITDRDSRKNGDINLYVISGCWLTFDYVTIGSKVDIHVNSSFNFDYDHGDVNNNCTIIAVDKGTPPMSANATVLINLLDVNDNTPEVHGLPTKLNISRFAELGTVLVSSINATDDDSGVNKELEFNLAPNDYFEYFKINQTNGEITLTQELESFKQDFMLLNVKVSDKGYQPLTTLVEVEVEIYDDNRRPFFKQNITYITIAEHSIPHNKEKGHIVKVTAYDIKEKDKEEKMCICTYNFTSHRDDLQIDPNSGLISFRHPYNSFDREKENQGMVVLEVVATDDGSPSKSQSTKVNINITDINDQAPVFEKLEYSFGIYQDDYDGKLLDCVHAEDLDLNPMTNYSMNITNTDVFHINASGCIFKNGYIEPQNVSVVTYKGCVYASDGKDDSKLHDTAIITIKVYDNHNKHSPRFTKGSYKANIRWNLEAGSPIVIVEANDTDTGDEGDVVYSIIGGNKRRHFKIDENGLITLEYQLDSSVGNGSKATIILTVEAKDRGAIPKSNTTNVIINVHGENPGVCVQGTAHHRKVVDLKLERQNWSIALYGLSGALCISICTTIVFLYKLRTHPVFLKKEQHKPNSKEEDKRISDMTHYEDLNKITPRRENPYSISNQRFVSSQSVDNFRSKWTEANKGFILPFNQPQHLELHRGPSEQRSNLRLVFDSEPVPDYMEALTDPMPDYE